MKGRRTLPHIERRDISAERPAVTSDGKIRGLAIPFNSFTTIGFGEMKFRERVAPGAVTKTMSEADTVYLDNHDPAKPIARRSAGTLVLEATERGVEYEADPSDTSYARDLVANVRAGNIRGNSFGFEVVKEAWGYGADGVEERTLLEIKLPEISACTFPAYPDTEIGMRDAYDAAMEARERYYNMQFRAKYDTAQIEAMGKKGHAFKNSDGHYSFPIGDREDLHNAIHAVGRGGASHDAIRRYIMRRAREMGLSDMIPDSWSSDGSVKSGQDAQLPPEQRDDPDGDEVAAMHAALAHLAAGDSDAAREVLEDALRADEDNDEDGPSTTEDSNGMVAHTTQGGAAVPVRTSDGIAVAVPVRTAQRIYDLVRALTPTASSNEALALLEPILQAPEPPAEERDKPKPDTSTSAVSRDSDEGRALEQRFGALKRDFRL